MATIIRSELSKNNKYWINKHRYYELKHFCLQYPIWKSAYVSLDDASFSLSVTKEVPNSNTLGDPTARRAVTKAYYAEKLRLIERTAMEADEYLYGYILKAVTENLSYNYLKMKLDIPCGRDMYYDRYRKFFWILSNARD